VSVQTGKEAHPAFSTTATGSFPGVKRQKRFLTTHPFLAPRLRKGWSYTFAYLLWAWNGVHFAFNLKR